LREQFPDNPYLKLDANSQDESLSESDLEEEKSISKRKFASLNLKSKGAKVKDIFKNPFEKTRLRKATVAIKIQKKADRQLSKPITLKRQNSADQEEFERIFNQSHFLPETGENAELTHRSMIVPDATQFRPRLGSQPSLTPKGNPSVKQSFFFDEFEIEKA
jgi:hypothetical protein